MNIDNPRIINYTLLLIALILTIAPFLYLAQYNHPSADDFCYARTVNYLGFVATQIDHFIGWSGRYMATAILTLMPIDHHDLLIYRLLPIFLFILFWISLQLFIYKLAPKASKKDIVILTFLIFFLYLFQAPNITEAFYWMAGSVTYQLPIILTLFLFSTIIHLYGSHNKQEIILFTILGSLLCITIIGLNEISMMVLLIIISVWTAIRFYLTRRLEKRIIILLAISTIFTGVSVFAPGNFLRMSTVPAEKFQLLFSLSGSVQLSIAAVANWMPVITLFILFFYTTLSRIANKIKEENPLPQITVIHLFIIIIFFLSLTTLCYLPSYLTQAGRPPTRTINVIYFNFILGCFMIVLITFGYFRNEQLRKIKIPPLLRGLFGIGIILILILLPNNIKMAYKDVLNGSAKNYDSEMEKRYNIMENYSKNISKLPPMKNKPATIFAYDIAQDPEEKFYYYNECLSDYLNETNNLNSME